MNNDCLKLIVDKQMWDYRNFSRNIDKYNLQNLLYRVIDLLQNDESNALGEEIINYIGSNHEGIYYPIVDDLIDVLEIILKHSQNNRKRKILILGLLNDLNYFHLDPISDSEVVLLSKKQSIISKLSKYSDENIESLL